MHVRATSSRHGRRGGYHPQLADRSTPVSAAIAYPTYSRPATARRHTRVAVTDGTHDGDAEYVRGPVWERNDEHETVATPPYGYEVLLDQDTRVPAAVIAAPFLEVLDDGLTWPQRPAGSAALLFSTSM